MKKIVLVTIEKELEIDIPDEMLTPEHVEAFSKTMWEIEGPDELFGHAARQIAYYGAHFVEGLGQCGHTTPDATVLFRELLDECEAEVLPHNALGQEPCADVCARSPGPTGYTAGD